MEVSLIRRALEFYSKSPDGQYDLEVVVPILKQWLEMAESAERHRALREKLAEGFARCLRGS